MVGSIKHLTIKANQQLRRGDLATPVGTKPLMHQKWPRAESAVLAAFDPKTRQCSMNCGPHADDPRSHAERKLLCQACWPVPSAKEAEHASTPLSDADTVRLVSCPPDKHWSMGGFTAQVASDKHEALTLARLYETIASDSYAMTFQTMGQYRAALLKLIKGK